MLAKVASAVQEGIDPKDINKLKTKEWNHFSDLLYYNGDFQEEIDKCFLYSGQTKT